MDFFVDIDIVFFNCNMTLGLSTPGSRIGNQLSMQFKMFDVDVKQ